MVQYLNLHKNEINDIIREYGLQATAYESIEEGSGNTNFLIRTTKRKYILTVFEIAHKRVEKLTKLLHWLDGHNFPTSRIQKLTNGDQITSASGHSAALKPFIEGQVKRDLNEDMLGQVGAAIAELHLIPSPDYLANQHAYGLQSFPALFDVDIDPEYESWLAGRYQVLTQEIPSGLPRGLIHGDVFYDNVLFEQSTFKAIIDFEEACNYHLIFDLGMAVVGLCTRDSKVILSKVRALVNGYQRIRELEAVEKDILQLSIEYAAIATSSWRFWKYNIDTPIAAHSQAHTQMAKIAKNISPIQKSTFQKRVFTQ